MLTAINVKKFTEADFSESISIHHEIKKGWMEVKEPGRDLDLIVEHQEKRIAFFTPYRDLLFSLHENAPQPTRFVGHLMRWVLKVLWGDATGVNVDAHLIVFFSSISPEDAAYLNAVCPLFEKVANETDINSKCRDILLKLIQTIKQNNNYGK